MPSTRFEPGSPRPQFKSDDIDRSVMGPAFKKGRIEKLEKTVWRPWGKTAQKVKKYPIYYFEKCC